MSLAKSISLIFMTAGLALGCVLLYRLQNNDLLGQPHRSLIQDSASSNRSNQWLPVEVFMDLVSPSTGVANDALLEVENHWRAEYEGLLVECWQAITDAGRAGQFKSLMSKKTLINDDWDINRWYQHVWQQTFELHPNYTQFKAAVHRRIDKSLAEYFEGNPKSEVRLDEIVWGGVRRDGIPPLKSPKMIGVGEADYLDDSNVVFGIEINGDARAYPKRILAHHEMFKDSVGGVSVNGVYCTLCGSMIVYETVTDGKHFELGTSGFLFRSNKLMYDEQTKSLWSTLEGRPVVGMLVGKGIQLKPLPVVTTTWSQWKKRHPDSTVLSLDTGFARNYAEGEAYKHYFATDELMFGVPRLDNRLKNKDEILAIGGQAATAKPLAIAADYLNDHRVFPTEHGGSRLTVLTDSSGANRVYETAQQQFVSLSNDDAQVIDAGGKSWQITESALVNDDGRRLPRISAHRAFWFGWFAQYPETRLIR